MLNVSPICSNNVNFGKKDINKKQDVVTRYVEKEATTGKKWGVGIASAIIPGLGQAINGEWGKFFGFLGGTALARALFLGGTFTGRIKSPQMLKVLGLSTFIIPAVWSIVDAVKNATSIVEEE